jgi:hypothetical protein
MPKLQPSIVYDGWGSGKFGPIMTTRPFKRRPPDPQLLGFLTAYDTTVADLALALREIILEEAPNASEYIYQVYTVAVWFGFTGQLGKPKDAWFCYITTHARHINLGFPYGAVLPDPNRVLEGEGKTNRHIKFRSMSDLERPFVRRYIQAAIEQAGAAAAAGGTGKTVVKTTVVKKDVIKKPVKRRRAEH